MSKENSLEFDNFNSNQELLNLKKIKFQEKLKDLTKQAKQIRKYIKNIDQTTCNLCQKKFVHKYTLQTHLKVIHHIKPHQCQSCESQFDELLDLKIHIQNQHIYQIDEEDLQEIDIQSISTQVNRNSYDKQLIQNNDNENQNQKQQSFDLDGLASYISDLDKMVVNKQKPNTKLFEYKFLQKQKNFILIKQSTLQRIGSSSPTSLCEIKNIQNDQTNELKQINKQCFYENSSSTQLISNTDNNYQREVQQEKSNIETILVLQKFIFMEDSDYQHDFMNQSEQENDVFYHEDINQQNVEYTEDSDEYMSQSSQNMDIQDAAMGVDQYNTQQFQDEQTNNEDENFQENQNRFKKDHIILQNTEILQQRNVSQGQQQDLNIDIDKFYEFLVQIDKNNADFEKLRKNSLITQQFKRLLLIKKKIFRINQYITAIQKKESVIGDLAQTSTHILNNFESILINIAEQINTIGISIGLFKGKQFLDYYKQILYFQKTLKMKSIRDKKPSYWDKLSTQFRVSLFISRQKKNKKQQEEALLSPQSPGENEILIQDANEGQIQQVQHQKFQVEKSFKIPNYQNIEQQNELNSEENYKDNQDERQKIKQIFCQKYDTSQINKETDNRNNFNNELISQETYEQKMTDIEGQTYDSVNNYINDLIKSQSQAQKQKQYIQNGIVYQKFQLRGRQSKHIYKNGGNDYKKCENLFY
ncbi:hypothetical protein PPERSA_04132 [Pseudocohnilembus persalinus]|uniref:C2H2-type domain-containing protein n=1 Tax=Pseudocohnilembus persalinus TaxID=266149 RepID=A0A0V0QN69_PSEPJ|nr:hypothetical protein PPERSA_04132 [Pseudocohnilembus persalinus]|eukprot:KRX03580.1 hypothetical protein PPERSA_04132 [Pseudocohnilembus persalinus]